MGMQTMIHLGMMSMRMRMNIHYIYINNCSKSNLSIHYD